MMGTNRSEALKLVILAALLLCLPASWSSAEPRWCAITGTDPTNKIIYPPIARAARVQGVVLLRMIYVPNGPVVRTEPVSGPKMLSTSLAGQLQEWTVRTDAAGGEECQTLVVANFELVESGRLPPNEPKIENVSSILRLNVEAEPLEAVMNFIPVE